MLVLDALDNSYLTEMWFNDCSCIHMYKHSGQAPFYTIRAVVQVCSDMFSCGLDQQYIAFMHVFHIYIQQVSEASHMEHMYVYKKYLDAVVPVVTN